MERLMTLREAADYAGLTPVALRAAALAGTLKAEKIGRDWIVTRAAVDAYMDARVGGRGRKPYTRKDTPDDTIR